MGSTPSDPRRREPTFDPDDLAGPDPELGRALQSAYAQERDDPQTRSRPAGRSETSIASEAINKAITAARDAGAEMRAADDWEGIEDTFALLREGRDQLEIAIDALEALANRTNRMIGRAQ